MEDKTVIVWNNDGDIVNVIIFLTGASVGIRFPNHSRKIII